MDAICNSRPTGGDKGGLAALARREPRCRDDLVDVHGAGLWRESDERRWLAYRIRESAHDSVAARAPVRCRARRSDARAAVCRREPLQEDFLPRVEGAVCVGLVEYPAAGKPVVGRGRSVRAPTKIHDDDGARHLEASQCRVAVRGIAPRLPDRAAIARLRPGRPRGPSPREVPAAERRRAARAAAIDRRSRVRRHGAICVRRGRVHAGYRVLTPAAPAPQAALDRVGSVARFCCCVASIVAAAAAARAAQSLDGAANLFAFAFRETAGVAVHDVHVLHLHLSRGDPENGRVGPRRRTKIEGGCENADARFSIFFLERQKMAKSIFQRARVDANA